MAIQLTEDGVHVPETYRDAEKIVIRTPTQTIDMSSGFPMMVSDGLFPLVTLDSYQDITDDDKETVENPHLYPDRISFKEYGCDVEEFVVKIE